MLIGEAILCSDDFILSLGLFFVFDGVNILFYFKLNFSLKNLLGKSEEKMGEVVVNYYF